MALQGYIDQTCPQWDSNPTPQYESGHGSHQTAGALTHSAPMTGTYSRNVQPDVSVKGNVGQFIDVFQRKPRIKLSALSGGWSWLLCKVSCNII